MPEADEVNEKSKDEKIEDKQTGADTNTTGLPDFLLGNRDREYSCPLYVPKFVERKTLMSKAERIRKIQAAGYNVFSMDAKGIPIDLLTDSGTGCMSQEQLGAMMIGDESYAGASSFFKLKNVITEITGLPFVVPTHQGRGAEKTLNEVMIRPLVEQDQELMLQTYDNLNGEKISNKEIIDLINKRGNFVPRVYILGNTHFDTTEGHIHYHGATPVDFTIEDGRIASKLNNFKGNIDIVQLEDFLKQLAGEFGRSQVKHHVPYVITTITLNSGGGQPVSIENIEETSDVCKDFGVPFFFDAARFAENAFFIREREEAYKGKDIREIILKMFSYVDGCTMSSKKDGIVPMGGFIAVRDKKLYDKLADANILFEGFPTYGGMSGMDMEALAVGLQESTNIDYLEDRISLVRYLGNGLKEKGIPIVEPIGGHAVFVDARKFYEGIIPEDQFPAQALTAYLFIEAGVRGVEIGSCLKGRDPQTRENIRPDMDLMRLAIPRRKYNREHMDVVIKALDNLYQNREHAKGLEIIRESEPEIGIRHFRSQFRIVE